MLTRGLQLTVKNSQIILKTSLIKRIPFLFITLILLIGIFSSERGTPRLWIPIAAAVLSMIGGLYTEKWRFNTIPGTVYYYRGLPFLANEIVFPLSSLEEIRFTLIENKTRRKRAILYAVLTTGKRYDIDDAYGKTATESLLGKAKIIAELCEVPLSTK